MNYTIWCNGQLIAAFKHESDRRVCLIAFEETYPDCVFTTHDGE